MSEISCRTVIEGTASGSVLRLNAPISFWGGVDPETGMVSDPRHPDFGEYVAGRVLAIPATIGSSSSSAILLELVRHEVAPAAVLLGRVDAILVLGIIVARELGYPTIPILEAPERLLETIPQEAQAEVTAAGRLIWQD